VTLPLRALLVEDSEDDAKLLLRELKQSGFTVTSQRVETGATLREALRLQPWDLVLSDWAMPGFGGLEALAVVRASGLDLPVIMVSGTAGEDTAVSAMRAGASDYLVKDRLTRLAPAVTRELREATSRLARRAADEQVRWLSHAVSQAPVSLVITNTASRIEYTNPKFTQLTGYTFEESRGQLMSLVKSGLTSPAVYTELWRTIAAGGEWRVELAAKLERDDWFITQANAFLDALDRRVPVLCTIEEAAQTMKAVLAALACADAGTMLRQV